MKKRRSFGHVRLLKSGKYQASYIGPDGGRHNAPTTFHNKAAATKYLSRVEISIEDGRWDLLVKPAKPQEEPEELIFGEYAERHIRLQTTPKGELLRASTRQKYGELLRNHLSSFKDIPVGQITTSMVNEWWGEELATGKNTTASKAYKLISSVMKRAVREGVITSSPCSVQGAHNATTGKKVRAATRKEVELIAESINPRFSVFVTLKAFAGLRFGEITELRLKDLVRKPASKDYFEINVSRAVVFVDGQFVVGKPKSSASIRSVVVKSDLTPLLDEHIANLPTANSEQLLFPSASGTWIRHDVFIKAWNSAITREGIEPDITPHSLRHHAGSHFSRAGGNLAELKQWLGDSSTSAVMRYVHPTGRSHEIVEEM